MENAGRSAAAVVAGMLRRDLGVAPSDARVAIVCGAGNNGGDGYVMARHLANRGVSVKVFATRSPQSLRGDARAHAAIVERMALPLSRCFEATGIESVAAHWDEAHVLVDALLGTGFKGPVRNPILAAIHRINAGKARRIVAVDIPSGMDGDTGRAEHGAVRADATVTFVAPKQGFSNPEARPLLGRVLVRGIGAPPWLVERAAGA